MVGFADGAPVAVSLEKGDDMIEIRFPRFQVKEKRSLAMQPECGRRDEGALDAVGAAFAERHARRGAGVAVARKIARQSIQEILDLFWRRERLEQRKFFFCEAEHIYSVAETLWKLG